MQLVEELFHALIRAVIVKKDSGDFACSITVNEHPQASFLWTTRVDDQDKDYQGKNVQVLEKIQSRKKCYKPQVFFLNGWYIFCWRHDH